MGSEQRPFGVNMTQSEQPTSSASSAIGYATAFAMRRIVRAQWDG